MQSIEWVDAKSLEQASELVQASTKEKPVLLKAGGMDVLDLLKEGIISPRRLVNLKTVPGLDQIEQIVVGEATQPNALAIGALVTLNTLDKSGEIRNRLPALAEACGHAATPQVRNAATLGGNLCQKPRCWYYRHDYFHQIEGNHNQRVREGQNQYHAIFDTDQSTMVQASTPATALIAYGARVEVVQGVGGGKGETTYLLEKFYKTPQLDSTTDTVLQPGQVIRRILVPIPPRNSKSAYIKQTERESYDWPICDVAVSLILDGRKVTSASIVMGWVAPTPRHAGEAEEMLVNKELTEDLAREAAKAVVSKAKPLSKNGYKVPILETVIRRTIMKCA